MSPVSRPNRARTYPAATGYVLLEQLQEPGFAHSDPAAFARDGEPLLGDAVCVDLAGKQTDQRPAGHTPEPAGAGRPGATLRTWL